MQRGRLASGGTPRVSTGVLLLKAEYEALKAIAQAERTDLGSLVRRAITRSFFLAGDSNHVTGRR